MTCSDAVVAVVLPSYGHPSLMIDAIESALRQQTALAVRIVLVNDGCPLLQTDQICRTYARAHPERIIYVHKANGGLSSARNRGVAVALQAWPDIDAFYFLVADNRLSPRLLEKSYQYLQAHPDVDWVFPDVLMFGSENTYQDAAGPFTRLQFLMQNYCDAASLVRRRVFDCGVGYDESMRQGYEDWEFWLQCIQAGFRGIHGQAVGFLYRKRPESMLANSGRDHPQIVNYIRRKHAGMFNLRHANALAGEEFARFAVYLPETSDVAWTSDLQTLERMSWADFARRLRRWRDSQRVEHCPPTFLVASEAVLQLLSERGLAANLLWLLEADLEEQPLAAVKIEQHFGATISATLSDETPVELPIRPPVHLCALRRELLDQCLRGHDSDGLATLAPPPQVRRLRLWSLRIQHCDRPRELPAAAIGELQTLILRQRGSFRSQPALTMIPPRRTIRPPFDAEFICRYVFQTPLPPPMYLAAQSRHIGFAISADSGTELAGAVSHLARLVQEHGWHAHVYVIGSKLPILLREFRAVFASIHLLPDTRLMTPVRLVSLFGMMDAVVNCQCDVVHSAAGDLGRLGVKLMTYLQQVDGPASSAVKYEHALHRILAGSRKLETWLMAWGVPREKIIHLPSGPGLDVPPVRVQLALSERSQRSSEQPLRVLCAISKDESEGLDRLAALMQACQRRGVQLDWRCLGEVSADSRTPAWEVLKPFCQPAGETAQALVRQYAWADVFVSLRSTSMSSLALRDAQQFGCVPLAVTAGAAEEIIQDGYTGFLFPDNDFRNRSLDAVVKRLEHLHTNRTTLRSLADQAAAFAGNHGWKQNARDWLACLNTWFPVRGG